jgi:hypothetical protein
MQPNPTDLQSLLDLGLPFIAAFLSYLFQMDHLSKNVNMCIAGATVILSAVAEAFVQHKVTGNPFSDFLLIASIAAALQIGSFAPITNWLKGIGSKTPATMPMPVVQRASLNDPQRD